MVGDLAANIERIRAYLLLALGSAPAADRALAAYLEQMISVNCVPDGLQGMMTAIHEQLASAGPQWFTGEGLSESQRALNWRLRGLSVLERAFVLLGSIGPSHGLDPPRVLGISNERYLVQRRATLRRLRRETAIVVSRQAIVAMDLRSIVTRLGILRVETAGNVRDLPLLMERHRPAVVIADTDGFSEATLAECLPGPPHADHVPAVLISTAGPRTNRFPITLGKPFSSSALRSAVLAAIGA